MNEDKSLYVGYWIRRFLCEYLITVRNLSANTQKSYRDTFRLLLPYIGKRVKKNIESIYVEDLSCKQIQAFLNEIENERKCSIKTRNQRLAAVYALAKYVAMNSPEYVEWSRLIHNIPVKKMYRTLITYLEKNEMGALLAAPNQKTEQGWRDYVLLLFLYNTGVRADEAASLVIRNVALTKGKSKGLAIVTIIGKGGKTRRCPLWEKTNNALTTIIGERAEDQSVFLNRLGQSITRFGIYEMVTRYANQIGKDFPDLKEKRVSPHTISYPNLYKIQTLQK